MLLDKKAKNYYLGLVKKNDTELFDKEIFTEENFDWAMIVIDSRVVYIDYQAYLVPMLDFANYKEEPKNPNKILKPSFNEEGKADITAQSAVKKGSQVFVNNGMNGDNLLRFHGVSLENNSHNCYSISFTFSEREDELKDNRKAFFGKFFFI